MDRAAATAAAAPGLGLLDRVADHAQPANAIGAVAPRVLVWLGFGHTLLLHLDRDPPHPRVRGLG